MSAPKMKFSKIDNLTSIGLMHYKFDGHTFVRSNYLLVKSILILFLALTTLIKYVLCLFFEQTDIIQLYIGSFWNYLSYMGKFYMGFVGLCLISWMSISHFTLNRFNRASNESFMLWMRLSDEISNDRPLVGISEEENSSFWDAEKQFNFYYNRALYLLLIGSYVTVNMQIFLVDYEVDTRTYLIVQCVHSVHHFFFIRAYFTIFYTPNFFHLGMLRFFTKKFDYIRQQAIGLQDDTRKKRKKKTKKLEDNEYDQRLGKLIHDFNIVYLELIRINNYFKYLSGINLFHFGFLTVIVTFVTQFSDLRLQILFYVVIYSMYILIFGLPFKLASGVLIEMSRVNRAFQNASFKASIETRRKVHSINQLLNARNSKVLCGFSCLDLFQLNTFSSISIFFQCISYILLLLKLSNVQNIVYYLPALHLI